MTRVVCRCQEVQAAELMFVQVDALAVSKADVSIDQRHPATVTKAHSATGCGDQQRVEGQLTISQAAADQQPVMSISLGGRWLDTDSRPTRTRATL